MQSCIDYQTLSMPEYLALGMQEYLDMPMNPCTEGLVWRTTAQDVYRAGGKVQSIHRSGAVQQEVS